MKGIKCHVDFVLKDGRHQYYFNRELCSFHGTLQEMQDWLIDRKVSIRSQVFMDYSQRLYFRAQPDLYAEFSAQFVGPRIKSACERKKSYATEDQAMTGVFQTLMKPNYRAKFNHRLLPYQCPDCGRFHIGHQFGKLEFSATVIREETDSRYDD